VQVEKIDCTAGTSTVTGVTFGGETSKPACLSITATATNPSGKLLYDADVFGRLYDANGEAALDQVGAARRGAARRPAAALKPAAHACMPLITPGCHRVSADREYQDRLYRHHCARHLQRDLQAQCRTGAVQPWPAQAGALQGGALRRVWAAGG
jgi:hypothetical protein